MRPTIMLPRFSASNLRRLELGQLWATVPVLALSATVWLGLATGTANIHGGTGYALLLLTVLLPTGTVATAVLLPVLFTQYRRAGREYSSPLAKPVLVLGTSYLIFSALVLWNFWP